MTNEVGIPSGDSSSQELTPSHNMATPSESPKPSESASSAPAHPGKIVVKVYGLIGHTRYIDLQFEQEHLVPGSMFIFEGKRYKIASIIPLNAENQFAINAVSVEYST